MFDFKARALRQRVSSPSETPLRSGLLTRAGLAEYATTLAEQHQVAPSPSGASALLARLEQNSQVLDQAYVALSQAAKRNDVLSSGAAWLLDNHHIIKEQVRDLRRDFPRGYYRSLPKLTEGELKRSPRVYAIAIEIVTHTDATLDSELIAGFIQAYQKQAVLESGELWAIPIMLRFALIENLRRLTVNTLEAEKQSQFAEELVEEIVGSDSHSSTDILLLLANKLRENPTFLPIGAVSLLRRLREKGSKSALTLQWLEARLKEQGQDPEEMARAEHYAQAANQASIGNTVMSLKQAAEINWQDWFESVSLVHRTLLRDPAGAYEQCDFLTRDSYRHRIETLARGLQISEEAIALATVEMAKQYQENIAKAEQDDRSQKLSHVGYYLVDEGRAQLEHLLGWRRPLMERLHDYFNYHAFTFYVGSIAILTIVQSLALFGAILGAGGTLPIALLGALLFFIPQSELATSIVQWLEAHSSVPTRLSKFDFDAGIPRPFRTIVTVQGLFYDTKSIETAIEGLEIRFLANDDPNLFFALLGDFKDSDAEQLAGDAELLSTAEQLVTELNERHCAGEAARFFVLFRRRVWNSTQQQFMGWERKRGKISEFNRLILGADNTSFLIDEPSLTLLRTIRFVITLDSDSTLPRGVAAKLAGTLAHPLNRPIFDEQTNVVAKGYAIIQPRVTVGFGSANASRFSAIFSGNLGLDPYTQLISDVYQDLFHEGSYIGKGIYDVPAFERALADRVPENSMLSHDLFEGCFARVALTTDIEIFDDFPSRYDAYAKRLYRWVRGDWQLLPWIFPLVRNAAGERYPNPISKLGRWKLVDNLRRSLVAPSCFVFLGLALLLLPGNPLSWLFLVMLAIAFPVYANAANALINSPRDVAARGYARAVGQDILRESIQAALTLCFLPYQAFLMLKAVLVTLYRVYLSKRNLLEWESAYHTEKHTKGSLASILSQLGSSLVLVLVFTASMTFWAPERLLYATPILLLWFASPWIAHRLSQTVSKNVFSVPESDRERLLLIAYDTWRYFDELLVEEHNFLVPDNLQLEPQLVVAARTSPTNIGLSILSLISAYDLGFLPLSLVTERMSKIFATLSKLERFHGHFLNWYQTNTLAPLTPRYVSTVDSGNLVGHLLAARSAFVQLLEQPLVTEKHWHYLRLRLALVRATEDLSANPHRHPVNQLNLVHLRVLETALETQQVGGLSATLEAVQTFLEQTNVTPGLLQQESAEVRVAWEGLLAALRQLVTVRQALAEQDRIKSQLRELITAADNLIQEVEMEFLYDSAKELFAIGYRIDSGQRDNSYYDLLASESRLGSFIAVATGEVPQKHWFSLGRSLVNVSGSAALVSWTGTMFEYLMPLLVMRDFSGTLLARTSQAVVREQQLYGQLRGVPWGVSESAYSVVDFEKTYQYKAFGVPSLGLKRGLAEDLVVSPYSSFLALLVDPGAALKNLAVLEDLGLRGKFGFYEAVDYTAERLSANESYHIVRSFLAHHQGMSLVAINNTLNGNLMVERFHADPRVRATELLLQERFPRTVSTPSGLQNQASTAIELEDSEQRETNSVVLYTPHTQFPRTQVLSNGHYTIMVDNAGNGFSAFDGELMLTRWREDTTAGQLGTYIFVRDLDAGKLWSVAYQPTRVEPDSYEVLFNPDKIEFIRRDFGILLHTTITVSPEDNVEVRQVTLTNLSSRKRNLEVISYAEVALAFARADIAHPAFSKMFIESEFDSECEALLFTRRPRSEHEERLYLMHLVALKKCWAPTMYETSRLAFLGRGNTIATPEALESPKALNGQLGAVLDPVAVLRARIELEESQSECVVFSTGFAKTREGIKNLTQRYHDLHSVTRAFEMAWSHNNIELRREEYSVRQMRAFQRLLTALIYSIDSLRGKREALGANRLTQSGFWRFGVSGDLPIVFLRVNDPTQIALVREALLAHQYIRMRGIVFDLVILNEYPGGYFQNFQEELEFLVSSGYHGGMLNQKGGVYLRTQIQLSAEEVMLLEAQARVVLEGERGSLSAQLKFLDKSIPPNYHQRRITVRQDSRFPLTAQPPSDYEFFNGLGGFVEQGRSYQLELSNRRLSPAPWCNVIANPNFGFLISESGGGYTWADNSRENRLTPWRNDPVTDAPGEVLYLRDTDQSSYWCPTPRPIASDRQFRVKHSFGYSQFLTSESGVESNLTISGAVAEKVKWWHLLLTNHTERERRLEAYLYLDWTLGINREESVRSLNSNFDKQTNLLYAVNYYNNEFAGRVAFLGANLPIQSYTCSRAEFLGRHGDVASPAVFEGAMPRSLVNFVPGLRQGVELSRKVGVGFDSCAVIKLQLSIPPKQHREVMFYLGEANSLDEARKQAPRYRALSLRATELEQVKSTWQATINAVQVSTPDRAFDILLNGWLLYQTLSCRINGRTALFQSGGAIGFRDQLQDVLALMYSRPELARAQILLHAAHQFPEGDVQHWWHPPTGRGVRTRISDDYLWLPYVVARYLQVTGDQSLLDEQVHFVEAPKLDLHQMEAYIVPQISQQTASLYEHCNLSLERAFPVGEHGLPLMGGGDWNDGMNEVGKEGKGESVWLAWFLSDCLNKFSAVCEKRAEPERALRYRAKSLQLVEAIEREAWDGAWYRRAFFDDGTPLGSELNEECKIDSIAQSWSVIAGGGDPARREVAMDSVRRELVNTEQQLVRLLTPPFNHGPQEPGYLKGYLPGVRENGAQYTHAAAWVAMARALQGRGAEAFELFSMINPINHTRTESELARYCGEPYVLAGDVYSREPHVGRAGWSWYTGSAGWMYQVGVEHILGLAIHSDYITINPCIPPTWKTFSLVYRCGNVSYNIEVLNPEGVEKGVSSITIDGEEQESQQVSLPASNPEQPVTVYVVVRMGRSS